MSEIASLAELAARAYMLSGRPIPESGIPDDVRPVLTCGKLQECIRRCDVSSLEELRPDAVVPLIFVRNRAGAGERRANVLNFRLPNEPGIERGFLSVYRGGGTCTHLTGDRRIVKRHAITYFAIRCPECNAIVALPRGISRQHHGIIFGPLFDSDFQFD